jgi:hypothetical protein
MSEESQAVDSSESVKSDAQIVDQAIEEEARRQGWTSKEKFHGDEDDWMDAGSFVKKSREINAILKQNNNRLQRELDNMKSKLNEQELTTKGFAEEFAKMKDNAYKRAIAELKSEKREATKEDNLELVDDLDERIDSLKAEQAKVVAKPQANTAQQPDLREFNEWHAENKWYDAKAETEMFDMAEAVAGRLSRENSNLTGRAFMDKVTEIVKGKFPEKFENPKRKSAPHEGGGARGESKGGRNYAALPADAKKACDRYVAEGLMTKEAYIEAYEWD